MHSFLILILNDGFPVATPPPHYYLHVLLPGGTDSLGKPEYELSPGTQAPLVGTLVKITLAQREEDSRYAWSRALHSDSQ